MGRADAAMTYFGPKIWLPKPIHSDCSLGDRNSLQKLIYLSNEAAGNFRQAGNTGYGRALALPDGSPALLLGADGTCQSGHCGLLLYCLDLSSSSPY